MKKESSNIKNIFNNIAEEKNQKATEEIKRKKFGVREITIKNLLGLVNILDLDNNK